jgi:U3 small nucleolar RNA-associated protein 4
VRKSVSLPDQARFFPGCVPTKTMSVDQSPVKVHRCRFVDYLPAAITALAFPPLPLPSLKGKAKATSPLKFPHLAIGRANGNIELAEWSNNNPTDQAPQAWVVSKVCCLPSFSQLSYE